MSTDYYQMGLGLGGAYFAGKEIARQRQRQEENDARIRQEFEHAQSERERAKAIQTATDAEIAAPDAAGVAPMGAGLPPPQSAQPIGVRDVAPPAEAAGLPAKAAPASAADAKEQALHKQLRLAEASRDPAKVMAARGALLTHQQNKEYAETAKEVLNAPPERLNALLAHINNNSKTMVAEPMMDEKGKPTGYTQVKIVKADGSLDTLKLSRADLATVAVGESKLQNGDMSGLADMAAVSKELAAAAGREMEVVKGATTVNNQAAHYQNTDQIARDRTAANIEIAGMRQEVAAMRAAAQRAGKEISPEDALALNKLALDVETAVTPQEKEQAIRAFKAKQAVVLGKLGKVVNIGEAKAAPSEEKVNPDGSITRNGLTYVPDAKTPGRYKRAEGLEPTALERALTGAGTGPSATGAPPAGAVRGLPTMTTPENFRTGKAPMADVDPTRLQRTSVKNFFGGVSYVYVDPATGKQYSVDEYNRLLGR